MAKYYYNGVLLPEIPAEVLAQYPYAVVVRSKSSENIRVYAGKSALHYTSSNDRLNIPASDRCRYDLSENGSEWGLVGTYDTATAFVMSSFDLLWSNHDIPNSSATATEIYFRGSQPTLTPIHLVNQSQGSSNSTTTCAITMTGCAVGNMLILAYVVRGNDNDPTLTDGWTKLGGGNVDASPGDLYHKLYFAYKVVTAESETVTITQTVTSRIYMVCSEYFGAAGVQIRSALASIGTSDYCVTGRKINASDVMLYGVTSSLYTSGRLQTVEPEDLDKIEGDADAERLACWFDGGLGALEHTFRTFDGTGTNLAILECVQLLTIESKYLIRSGSNLYTVTDGALVALAEMEISAEVFQTYGVDEMPAGSLLVNLTDPEILYWHDSTDELPNIELTVTGSPPVPQVVVTNVQDMSDPSILGIESVTITATDDVLWAISFDGGVTWKAYNGSAWVTLDQENSGMTAETFQNISLEAWAEVVTSQQYIVRFVLMDLTSHVESIVFNYINP